MQDADIVDVQVIYAAAIEIKLDGEKPKVLVPPELVGWLGEVVGRLQAADIIAVRKSCDIEALLSEQPYAQPRSSMVRAD